MTTTLHFVTVLLGETDTSTLAAGSLPLPSQDTWDWANLLQLSFKGGGLILTVGPIILTAALLVLGWFAYRVYRRWKSRASRWDTTSVKVKFGNLFELEIKPNHDTVRIAYQAWVEISTRKVGLPFDDANNVVVEVYNSWYEVFRILRELAKTVPAHRLRDCPDTQKLVDILLRVLNDGLRPHLTRWQARFRRWYETAKCGDDSKDKTPQEIQTLYPQYEALVADLKSVNGRFVTFAKTLRRLAEGSHNRYEPERGVGV